MKQTSDTVHRIMNRYTNTGRQRIGDQTDIRVSTNSGVVYSYEQASNCVPYEFSMRVHRNAGK
jgi:hypothetical protein